MPNPIQKSDRNELHRESDRRLLEQALAGLNETDRTHVLEWAALTGVEPDDPIYPTNLLVARSLVTIAPLPTCLEQFRDDLKGFKATAYEMRLTADRVSNLLREKTFSQSPSGIPINSVIWYCLCSFMAGVVVTAFLALVMAIARSPLPPTSQVLPLPAANQLAS
jgi:hypothetical protein